MISAAASFKRFGEGPWVKAGEAPVGGGRFGPTDYKIRVVYFVPRDRRPADNYQEKIAVVLGLVSDVITKDLRAKGLQTDGPQFEEHSGKPVVHLLNGHKAAREYNDLPNFNSVKHFAAITREVDQQLGSLQDHVVMVFAETYEEGPAARVWPGHVARAAAQPPNGGVAVFSAWMLKNEFCSTDIQSQRRGFVDQAPIRGRTAIGHRGPNSPRADFIEDGIGGVLHELAHTFGLPHDHRAKEVDIMGEGFRNLRWNVAQPGIWRQRATFSNENAWLLMSSRYLNPRVDRTDNQPPVVVVQARRTAQALSVTVTATDENELAAVVLLDLDGSDRKLITGRRLSGKSQTVTQLVPASLLTDGNINIQIIVVDRGGNHTKITRNNL